MDSNRLVTAEELAEILNVPISWIYQHTRLGRNAIPMIKMGKYVRFNPEEVIEFFKNQNSG